MRNRSATLLTSAAMSNFASQPSLWKPSPSSSPVPSSHWAPVSAPSGAEPLPAGFVAGQSQPSSTTASSSASLLTPSQVPPSPPASPTGGVEPPQPSLGAPSP